MLNLPPLIMSPGSVSEKSKDVNQSMSARSDFINANKKKYTPKMERSKTPKQMFLDSVFQNIEFNLDEQTPSYVI